MDFILHNLWFRELAVVGLILIAVIVYYIRYVRVSRQPEGRKRRQRLVNLVGETRVVVIALFVLLLVVVGYDRVLPMVTGRSQTSSQVASKRSRSSVKSSKTSQSTSTSSATQAEKDASKAASEQEASEKAASEKAAGEQAAQQAQAAQSSSVPPKKDVGTVSDTTQAATVVSGYYGRNPNADGAPGGDAVYKDEGPKQDAAGITYRRIVAYVNGTAKHVYWVYEDNMFDVKDDFAG